MAEEQTQKVVYDVSSAVKSAKKLTEAFNNQAKSMLAVQKAAASLGKGDAKKGIDSLVNSIKGLNDLRTKSADTAAQSEKSLTKVSEIEARKRKDIEIETLRAINKAKQTSLESSLSQSEANLNSEIELKKQASKRLTELEKERIRGDNKLREIELRDRLRVEDQARNDALAAIREEAREKKKLADQQVRDAKRAADQQRIEANRQERLRKQDFATTIRALNAEAKSLNKTVSTSNKEFGLFNRSLGVFGGTLKTIISFGAVGGLVSQLAGALPRAAELSNKLAEIQTISQDLNDAGEFKGIRRGLEELGKDIRAVSDAFNLNQLDVVAAQYEAVSNQITGTADSVGFLKDAAVFAKVSASSLIDSVNLLSSALNSFQLPASRADQVAARFFRAIDLGRFTSQELANDLGRAAVLANSLGIRLEELDAAYATITIQGVKLANAQTFITNVMLKLINPTEEMTRIFKEWGVSSARAAIEVYGLGGVIQRLQVEASKGNGSLAELADQFSTIRAIVGANILGQNLDKYNSNLRKIIKADEAYVTAFGLRTEQAGEIFQKELNKIQNFFTSDIGNFFVKTLSSWSKSVDGLADSFITSTRYITVFGGSLLAVNKAGQVTTSVIERLSLQQSRLSNALQVQATIQAEINRLQTAKLPISAALNNQMVTATANVTKYTAATGVLRATLATVTPALAIGAVTLAIGVLVNRMISLGQIQKNVFESITESAKLAAESTSKQIVKSFQDTADKVNSLYKTFSRVALRNTANQISEANSRVTSLIRLADIYKDILSRGFTVAEGDLNTQVSLYKLLNNTISESIRVVKDFGESTSDSLKEAIKDFDALEKAADKSNSTLRDFKKEFELSREAPGTLNSTVDSEVFNDLLNNVDNIDDANKKLSTLADLSTEKFGQGLALFDLGQITLGNKAVNEAVTLLQKVKEEAKKLREENPNGLLNVPTQEELTNILATYNQEVNRRIAQTEGLKVQNLISESDRLNSEAKKAFESRDIDRAEKLFSESQDFLREASKISEAANQIVPGAFPEVTDFISELENRSNSFTKAIDSQTAEQLQNQVSAAFNQVDLYRDQLDNVFEKLNQTVQEASARGLSPEAVSEISNRANTIVDEIFQVQDFLDQVTESINKQPNVKGIEEVLSAAADQYEFFLETIKSENESINVEASDQLQIQQQQLDLITKITEGLKTQSLLAKDNNKENREKLKIIEEERKANLKALQRLGPNIPKQAFEQLQDYKDQIVSEQEEALKSFSDALNKLRANDVPSELIGNIESAFKLQTSDPSLENIDNLNKLIEEIPDNFKLIFDDVIPTLNAAQEDLSALTNVGTGIDQLFSDLEAGNTPLEVFTHLLEKSNDELERAYQLQKVQNEQIQASEKFTKSLNIGEEAVTQANQKRQSIDEALANAIGVVTGELKSGLSNAFFTATNKTIEDFLRTPFEVSDTIVDKPLQNRRAEQLLALREAQSLFQTVPNLTGLERDQALSKLNATLIQFEDSLISTSDGLDKLNTLNQDDIATKLNSNSNLTSDQKIKAFDDAFGVLNSLDTRTQGLTALAIALQEFDPQTAAQIRDVVESLKNTAVRDDVLKPALEALQNGVRALTGVDGVEGSFTQALDKSNEFQAKNNQLLQDFRDSIKASSPDITEAGIDAIVKNAVDSAGIANVQFDQLDQLEIIAKATSYLAGPNAPLGIRLPGGTQSSGGRIPHFATGGKMPVRRGQDSVMAALTPGEFVIRKSVADKLGNSNLHRINNGLMPRYASGGTVKDEAKFKFDLITKQLRDELVRRYFAKLGGSYKPTGFSSISRTNNEASLIGVGIDNPFPKSTGPQRLKKPDLPFTIGHDDPVIGPLLDQIKFYKDKFGFFATGGKIPEGQSILVNQFASLQELINALKNDLRGRGGYRKRTTNASDLLGALGDFSVKKASGGFVPNTPNMGMRFGTDSVLSAVTPGDFVVKKHSAQRLAPLLNTLASGGRVEETQGFGIGNDLNILKSMKNNKIGSLTITLSELLRKFRQYASGGKVFDLLQDELKDTLDIFIVPDPPAIKEIPKVTQGFSFTSGIRTGPSLFGAQFYDNQNSVGPRVQGPSNGVFNRLFEDPIAQIENKSELEKIAEAINSQQLSLPDIQERVRQKTGYKPATRNYDQFRYRTLEEKLRALPSSRLSYLQSKSFEQIPESLFAGNTGLPSTRIKNGKYERLVNGKWEVYDPYLASGGLVYPGIKSFNLPAKGTDTVPTMLTPGEFVVNKDATKKFLPLLQKINRDALPSSDVSINGIKTNIPGVKRYVSDTPMNTTNNVQLISSGDEKIDAKRLIYHINREQRIGTTQVRGALQRRVVY